MTSFEQDRIDAAAKANLAEAEQVHKTAMITIQAAAISALENLRTRFPNSSFSIISHDRMLFHSINDQHEYGIVDSLGNEVVPYGRYKWIQNTFVDGFTRAMGKGGMGLLDIEGNVILEGFKEIWNFNEDFNDLVVKADGVRYSISRDNLQKIRQLVKHSRKPLTAKDIQDYLEYKEYLQHDEKFNAGIEVLSLVDFWKEKIR